MRILMTNTGPWGTGSFTTIEGVKHALKTQGHEVKVLFPDNGVAGVGDDYYYTHPDYDVWRFPIWGQARLNPLC